MRARTRPILIFSLLLTLLAALHAAAQTPCAPTANPVLLGSTSAESVFPAQITNVVERRFMALYGLGQLCPQETNP